MPGRGGDHDLLFAQNLDLLVGRRRRGPTAIRGARGDQLDHAVGAGVLTEFERDLGPA